MLWLVEVSLSPCGAGSVNRTKHGDGFVEHQLDSEDSMPYMPSEPLVELYFETDQVLVIRSEVETRKASICVLLPKSPPMCGQRDLNICSV